MDSYAIAVKRQMRDQAPGDWKEQIAQTEGISRVGDAGGSSIQVQATPAGIEEVRRRFGALCHIEPLIIHTKK